jgi:SAM-dependent methyltransferase
MPFEARGCPNCGRSDPTADSAISSNPRAEDLSFTELKDYWRGFRKQNVHFSYVRCSSCLLLFCPVYFSSEQLHQLYEAMDDNTNGESLEVLNHTQNSYVNELTSRVTLKGDVLELGGDIGLLTAQLLKFPEVRSVTVIEPNIETHAALTRIIGDRGRVVAIWSEIDSGKRFDAIVGVHVLDHLLDLNSDLSKMVNHLNPNGFLFFVTHDEGSLLRKALRSKWPPYCLQHPQIFNTLSIKTALNPRGYNQIDVFKTTNIFTLRHIIELASKIFGLPAFIAKLFPNMAIRIRLGNIATLAYKKDL